jgi:hypothetical protein
VVRLEQRVIQEETAAYIILTDCPALNRVLVHDVYLSNSQRGGTKIMDPNGITQLVVQNDVHGIRAVQDWLSVVPAVRGQPLPIIESQDAVTREIEDSPPPDWRWSDNAVIVFLIPPGKPELAPVAAKTIAVDDSDPVPPRMPSATQLGNNGVGNCGRPAEGSGTQARCRLGM